MTTRLLCSLFFTIVFLVISAMVICCKWESDISFNEISIRIFRFKIVATYKCGINYISTYFLIIIFLLLKNHYVKMQFSWLLAYSIKILQTILQIISIMGITIDQNTKAFTNIWDNERLRRSGAVFSTHIRTLSTPFLFQVLFFFIQVSRKDILAFSRFKIF